MAKRLARHTPPPGWKDPLAPQQPLATARWLAAAVGATLGLAGLCVYLTFCLLFWQGQWQLVFKPSRAVTTTPASAGLMYEDISFDATEAGILQLHGWWIPAATPSRGTLLLMHDGVGNLSGSVPQIKALHSLGLDVFAFDYRGFGQSQNLHPSQASTYEDANAAWQYLTDTRHVPGGAIVLDGVGLGAAIAVEVARLHPQARAVILEQPSAPILDTLRFNPQTRLLPVRLLFHDRFDPGPTLETLATPKLFLFPARETTARYYDRAAGPKAKAVHAASYQQPEYLLHLQAFLGEYAARP